MFYDLYFGYINMIDIIIIMTSCQIVRNGIIIDLTAVNYYEF